MATSRRDTGFGRFVAGVVMIVAIGFTTIVTALITSTFVEAAQRQRRARRSAAQRERTERVDARAWARSPERLAAIEARLDAPRRPGHPRETPDSTDAGPYPEAMARGRIEIAEEIGAKKAFAWAIDWPGWCSEWQDGGAGPRRHSSRTRPATRGRQGGAGSSCPSVDGDVLDVVESVTGGSGTDFGVPSAITDARSTARDAGRGGAPGGARRGRLDGLRRVAAGAPASLRKGPRGGGRDRDKMIGHVIEADHAYAREIGVRLPEPPLRRARGRSRRSEPPCSMSCARPSDGGPLADRKWTQRYAARRIAWHALDHAWEMEDRSEPG